ERLSGRRPGNAIGSQPDPTLEALDRRCRSLTSDPIDRAGVKAARMQRDLQRGDAGVTSGERARRGQEREKNKRKPDEPEAADAHTSLCVGRSVKVFSRLPQDRPDATTRITSTSAATAPRTPNCSSAGEESSRPR